jgi:hypothetical protein
MIVYCNVASLVSPLISIGQGKWEILQSKTKNWSGLDKFCDVYNTTSWQDGPWSHYMHPACYISISSSDKLEKARRRKNKESDIAQCPSQTSSSEMQAHSALCDDDTEEPLQPKRLRSFVGGPLNEKTKCVWRMQGVDAKHPNRERGKLFRLNTHSAWHSFKQHPVLAVLGLYVTLIICIIIMGS